MTPSMTAIQQSILEIMKACVRELKETTPSVRRRSEGERKRRRERRREGEHNQNKRRKCLVLVSL